MFYCYILKSSLVTAYYIGSCKDIEKRIKLHNSKLVPSTKRYAPWILVYNESFDTLSQARKHEAKIKSWKSRSAIEKLIKHFKALI